MREALRRVARRHRTAVISGRDLPQLRRLVGLDEVYYAGSHGFDLAGPDGWHERLGEGERFLDALDDAERALREGLAGVEGHSIERKAFDIAVHYRQVPASRVAEVEPVVDRVLETRPRLRKGRGKKVFEIQPDVDWDKGRAVRWLLGHLGLDRPGVVPIYIGDDLTDENAFRELAGAGLSVAVRDGSRNTSADYGLDDPQDVLRFLEFLRGAGRGRG
jgi:trehalose 6-phosphate phosphatase